MLFFFPSRTLLSLTSVAQAFPQQNIREELEKQICQPSGIPRRIRTEEMGGIFPPPDLKWNSPLFCFFLATHSSLY